jgi:hypothetical protein
MSVGNPSPGYYADRTANVGYVKDVFVKWTSGASGAVASSLGFAEVVSITHGATGVFVIQFSQGWNDSRNFTGNVMQASYSATGACTVRKTAQDSTAGTLTVLVVTAAGAAVEPTTGDVIELCFQVATATGYP